MPLLKVSRYPALFASLVLGLACSHAGPTPGGPPAAARDVGAPGPRGFAYAPGTRRYNLTTLTKRSQDQGGGRAPFAFEVTTTQLVTVDVAPHGPDTLGVSITLDSIAVKSTLAAPDPELTALRGTTLAGTMSPRGRVYVFGTPGGDIDPRTRALYGAFRRFFPRLPDGHLTAGATWADTATDVARPQRLDVTTKTVTTSKLAGDTTVAGQRAWRIERNSVITAAGAGHEGGRILSLHGDGTITGAQFVTPAGVYLGSTAIQSYELRLAMDNEEGAPILQTITSKVELLNR